MATKTNIDLNKPPVTITTDWTTLNNKSEPYYLAAETKTVNGRTLNLENRYVVTVVTDYKSAGSSRDDLATRLEKAANKEKGFVRILNYYDKNPGQSDKRQELFGNVMVEGWDIKPRPNSRLKILVSIAAVQIDGLPGIVEGDLGLQTAAIKVRFNTKDLYKKINNLRSLLEGYDAETRKLFGRIPKLSFKSQSTKINQTIPALSKLMLDNEYTYQRGSDMELIFGMSADYSPSYVVLRDNECHKPLDKNFDNFRKSLSFSNARNNRLLSSIDELDKLFKDSENLPIKEFIDNYIYDPPKFDFSTAKMFSNPEPAAVKKAKEKANEKTSKTYSEYSAEERLFGSQEFKDELKKNLDSASEFVGDSIIGNLRELSNLTPSVNDVYKKVLNKVPIRSLIEAALECLNFRGLDFLTNAKLFLNQAEALSSDIKKTIFDIPTIYLKDDLPIVDYLDGIYESIKSGIIRALLSTLFKMVIEIIKMLLDFCKECALQNEAEGRGRFDGLNFGGMSIGNVLGAGAQSFTAAAVGAIETGITSTRINLPGGQSTSVAEQQEKLIAQTQQSAKNPLLLPGELELHNKVRGTDYKNYVGDEKLQEELTQQANQAKEEMGGFLSAASSVLTPAEAGNMMLGCGASQDAIDTIKNLASNYPSIRDSGLMESDEDVLGFFNDIGKLSGYTTVLQTVKEITDRLPQEFECLCDPDDTELRKNLLSKKDMPLDLIKEQIDSSNARDKKRLEELNALLQKDNILDGLIPPIYCHYDPKTGKTVPGLINRHHPKFDFTMDQLLGTLYDSVATTFNRDVVSYVPTVTVTPTVERIIPRTVTRKINGKVVRVFNAEFLDLVGKGQYSFGSLPPGAVDQNGETMKSFTSNEPARYPPTPSDSGFVNVNWLGATAEILQSYGFTVGAAHNDTPDPNNTAPEELNNVVQQAQGMSKPFPESEMLYEYVNSNSSFYDNTNPGYRKSLGGRSDPNGYYSQKYGYSPVPVVIKERGHDTFAPGFQETYRTFCHRESGLNKLYISPLTNLNNNLPAERFKFDVPNKLLDNLNIDLETLKGSTFDSDFFTPQDTRGSQSDAQIGAGFKEALGGLFGKINDLGFSLNYDVPWGWIDEGYDSEDKFRFIVAADTPTAFRETSSGAEQLELNTIISGPQEKINKRAVDCYSGRNLDPLHHLRYQDRTPQDNFFRSLVDDSFNMGPQIYQNLELQPRQRMGTNTANLKELFDTSPAGNLNYYNEVWRDIFCSFTSQIGADSNPMFDLKNLNALDLSPMRIENQKCPAHLLDVDAVKNRIKQEYSVIQCLEASFPNTTGLGSNKDNPFEKSNLGGVVLLILRTYITEIFLRSLQVFYWFRYKQPQDVDNLLVLYIGRYITSEIEKEGYFTEFEKEVLDLYNRNVDLPLDPSTSERILETDYDVAIKFLVRQQIWSVANRMSKLVGARGDTSIDTILLEQWIRMVPIQRSETEPRLNASYSSANNDLEFISPQIIKSLTDGTLSPGEILQISQDIERAPSGFLFRKYFGLESSPNPNMPYPQPTGIKIWSLNEDSNLTNAEKYRLNNTPYAGTEDTSPSKKIDKHGADPQHTSRAAEILLTSGLSGGHPDPSVSPRDYSALEDNWDNLTEFLSPAYQYGVSEDEKRGMSTLIQFTAMTANPSTFNVDGGFDNGAITCGTETYYPGWFYDQVLSSSKIEFPPGIRFSNNSAGLMTNNNYGFWHNFSSSIDQVGQRDLGSPSHGPYVDYEIDLGRGHHFYGALVANGLIFDPTSTFSELTQEVFTNATAGSFWSPTLDHSEITRMEGVLNRGSLSAVSIGTSGVRDEVLEGVTSWQQRRREIEFDGDDYGRSYSAPDASYFDTDQPRFKLWREDPYYLRIGNYLPESGERAVWGNPQGYIGLSEIIRPTLVPNFLPRYLKDFNGVEFRFGFAPTVMRSSDRAALENDPASRVAVLRDPWRYWGPARTFQRVPVFTDLDNAQHSMALFANPVSNASSILNPDGTRDLFHLKTFYHAIAHIDVGSYSAPSLLDLDPLSILHVLKWERAQVIADSRIHERVEQQYDKWINEWENAFRDLSNAEQERLKLRSDLLSRVNDLPPPRRPMEVPPTSDYGNGGLVLEPYIRAVELNTDPNDPINASTTAAGMTQKINNKLLVTTAKAGSEWARTGIINIDEFDDFIQAIASGGRIEHRDIINSESALADACGANLPQNPQVREYEFSNQILGDYFEELHLGFRLSYVMPIKLIDPQDSAKIIDQDSQLHDHRSFISNSTIKNTKSYYIKESANGATRTVNIIPITGVEMPFNMHTSMRDARSSYEKNSTPQLDDNGFLVEATPVYSKFFKSVYQRNLRTLISQLNQTEDYALLFKYLFPVDRMLGINNIYSNTYLSTIKNVDTVFDATKEELRQLLFILLDSGNYEKSKCAPSNREMMESMLNGFDIKGLAGQMAMMILKSSVLIFKGFMETADINILLSKRIIDLIHVVNKFIAQSQQLINQSSQAVSDTASGISDLATALYETGEEWATGTTCTDLVGPGSCKSKNAVLPSKPDASLFDPIEENFIPEPQIWAVSLALLPATIFAPFFFGPPLTIPFGFVYWALDYKPEPNWLNSMPPSDWINDMLNGKKSSNTKNIGESDENCSADLGLPPPGSNASVLNAYYAASRATNIAPTPGAVVGPSSPATQQTVDNARPSSSEGTAAEEGLPGASHEPGENTSANPSDPRRTSSAANPSDPRRTSSDAEESMEEPSETPNQGSRSWGVTESATDPHRSTRAGLSTRNEEE